MKILVIRFSSIGDLTQALSLPAVLKEKFPQSELHFLTRKDLSELLENNKAIDRIITLDRKKGFKKLLSLGLEIKNNNYDLIYDAHNNLRSTIVRILASPLFVFLTTGRMNKTQIVVKPMQRLKRFLLLQFKLNFFDKPFSGQRDLIKPLEKINIPFHLPKTPQLFFSAPLQKKMNELIEKQNLKNFLVFVPSAAYELKRWPLSHWKHLIELNAHQQIVILAGPHDDFTKELEIYQNVINLTGKTSLLESAYVISKAQVVVSNDTGLLHMSEQLGKLTLALMGPAPFGYPSRLDTTTILEKHLPCRPCSKHGQGPCTQKTYQECMVTITPSEVHTVLQSKLAEFHDLKKQNGLL